MYIPLIAPSLVTLEAFVALFPELEHGVRPLFADTSAVKAAFVVDRQSDPARRTGLILTNIFNAEEAARNQTRSFLTMADGSDVALMFLPECPSNQVCFAFHWDATNLPGILEQGNVRTNLLNYIGGKTPFYGDRATIIARATDFVADAAVRDGKMHRTREADLLC